MLEIFGKYMGTGLMLIWFLLALLYLFFHEKRKNYRILMIYMPCIVLLLFFNPLFFRMFYGLVGDEIYFRLCWLLPVIIVIAYAAVSICESLQGMKRTCFALIAALLVCFSGKLVYSSPLYSTAENQYHVPQTVVELCDAIRVEGREVMAVFPDEFLLYVRQYSPVVCMPYGRDALMGAPSELHDAMIRGTINAQELASLAKQSFCHYVIVPMSKPMLGSMFDYDYEIFKYIDGYTIYRDKTVYLVL